ncbi:zf-PARP-domain-containing protein [Whalleya microplaca]|nr:zf-PARP-domain-containing protein [Whalleya microplaca]
MSSYRVEISANNRAGCQDSECKKGGQKITKGQLRFGTWVTLPDGEHGSWKWRHWGCVSGKTISNLQEKISSGDGYEWDMIDGYDEMGDHTDIQEKIRRVVTQGHIDAEDFNGDPDFNVPGKTAIRGRAKKPKAVKEDEADGDEGSTKKPTPKKPAKRGRKKVEEEEEEAEEEAQPAKKKAKGGRKTKKAVVEDEDEEPEAPAPVPVKKTRGKKAVQAPSPDLDEDEEAEEEEPVSAPKAKAKATKAKGKGGRKAKAAQEDEEAPAPKARRGRPRKAKVDDEE